MAQSDSPWRVPLRVEDVPENGVHIELCADDRTRAAIAGIAGVREVPRLDAVFDVSRRGRGLHVVGAVSATVGQTCVVTLEAIENEISEAIDLVFAPSGEPSAPAGDELGSPEEPPDALVDGMIDLGALATEFLILGIDPYPRKPGAVFEAATIGAEAARPFAVLEKLKRTPRSDPE